MKSQLVIACLFFVAFIANLTHWRFRKGEQLFHYPMKGSIFKAIVHLACLVTRSAKERILVRGEVWR